MLKIVTKKYYYIPIIGIFAFVATFIWGASKYPGGSINYVSSTGYSFVHNFLCDLMLPISENGIVNPARPIGIVAHFFLSLGMISFFYILPKIFPVKNRNTKLVQVFGMLSMSVLFFMYTNYHDLFVTLTGVFGTFALIPFFIELVKYPTKNVDLLAYFCVTLSLLVFFSYETKIGFYYLPLLQKITFFFDACWVISVSLIVRKKMKSYRAVYL